MFLNGMEREKDSFTLTDLNKVLPPLFVYKDKVFPISIDIYFIRVKTKLFQGNEERFFILSGDILSL